MKLNLNLHKTAFPVASHLVPSFLLFNFNKNILLPNYTIVSNEFLPHINHLFKPVSSNRFIKDLEFILRHFEPIDLPTLIDLKLRKEKITKRYFHLTIDDGLKECYDIILPILKSKGIPCTFFLNPSFLENQDLMYRYKISLIIEDISKSESKKQEVVKFIKRKLGVRRDATTFLKTVKYSHRRFLNEIAQLTETNFDQYLKSKKPYLSTDQVQKIISEGFLVGAHSMDHPEYHMIPEEEQLKQTVDSINYIKSHFHTSVKAFSFPFSDIKVSLDFFYKLYNPANPIVDISFGSSGLKTDIIPLNLQRIVMDRDFSGKEIIKGEFIKNIMEKIINNTTIKRK
jgi:peptidoglycan/xylan/chitin deacetylase (PgdA/CDA1 family)